VTTENNKSEELNDYLGEYVKVYLRSMNIVEGNVMEQNVGIMTHFVGYVIDITPNYIHLGDTPDEMSRSIDLTEVGAVEAVAVDDDDNMEIIAAMLEKDDDGVH